MIVGTAFSGKSSVINLLKKAMSNLNGKGDFLKVKVQKMNPKAIDSF